MKKKTLTEILLEKKKVVEENEESMMESGGPTNWSRRKIWSGKIVNESKINSVNDRRGYPSSRPTATAAATVVNARQLVQWQ